MRLFYKILKISILVQVLITCSSFFLKGQPARLVVIDPLVENDLKYFSDTDTMQRVITLPNEGNPIKFITGELKKSQYDEVHLYMLTKPGSIIFDELNIISENIGEYSGDFNEWKSLIKSGSEIVIHSTDLTSIPEGLFLVKKITEFTGRVVIVKK
jgi:hypothetical protein